MQSLRSILIICLTGLFIASCDETKKVIDVAGNVQLSGAYTVSSINNTAMTEIAPTIQFLALDKTIKGETGCNSYFGNYALDLYALSFSEIGSTEMACDQPIMDVENAFLQALRNTGSYQIENGALTLYSKNDRSVLMVAMKERTPQE